MKIKQKTATQMVLTDHLWWVYMIGIVFFLIGVGTFFAPSFLNDIPTMWSIGFATIGLVVLLVNKVTTLTFDTSLGTLQIQQRSALSKTLQTHQLSEITGVQLQNIITSGSRGGSYGQIIQLTCKDGKVISFDTFSGVTTSSWKPSGKQKDLAQEIASFLNLQFLELGAPTWSDAVSMIKEKMIEAKDKANNG